MTSLSPIPLLHEPGEVWEYSLGVDVLARIVEVVSGQPFDQFLETRLFKPLGMVDTGFFVPPDKLSRLVDPIPGGRPPLWDISKPTSMFSGGGGLASTAPDYLRFCEMLLNGGTLDGVRILSPTTVKQMTTNTLPPETRFAARSGSMSDRESAQAGAWALRYAPTRSSASFRAPSAATTGAATGAPISGSIRSRDWRWSS